MKQRNKNLKLQARIKAWEALKPADQRACKRPGSQKK